MQHTIAKNLCNNQEKKSQWFYRWMDSFFPSTFLLKKKKSFASFSVPIAWRTKLRMAGIWVGAQLMAYLEM